MKCTVPPALPRAIADCQAVPRKIAPDAIASLTSCAPCANTRPAPRALCPTSELPMSSSEGRPTALPWALSCGAERLGEQLVEHRGVRQVHAVRLVALADADTVHDDEHDRAWERVVTGKRGELQLGHGAGLLGSRAAGPFQTPCLLQ